MIQRIVDERRVHDDVAVVAEEQVGAALLQLLQSRVADAVAGVLDAAVDVGLDLALQGGHAVDALDFAAQVVGNDRLEQPAERSGQTREAVAGEGGEEGVVGEQALEDGADFRVGIGSDGFELAH
ncbi:hypothetical protein D9M71_612170 [compost metagenome]